MKAATARIQDARLLSIDEDGQLHHWPRAAFPDLLDPGDLVIANDAATLPASLSGFHVATGASIEVRLAARHALDAVHRFTAVVFGAGDFRTRTEHRPPPPVFVPGDTLGLGPLKATIIGTKDHPRLVELQFEGSSAEIWEGLSRHGHPIQYSHVPNRLAIWDTWTAIASLPVAFEPPSAGFALDWRTIASVTARGIRFATITHAAGISSTGDEKLDALLPFDEPYRIPPSTAEAIEQTRVEGGRIIAIGTTVVRALEHAALRDGIIKPGDGTATQKLGPDTPLRVVNAMLSGTHEPGTSHYELLRAFVDDDTLGRIDQALNQHDYRTHEFGDSVFIAAAPKLPLRYTPCRHEIEIGARAGGVRIAAPSAGCGLDPYYGRCGSHQRAWKPVPVESASGVSRPESDQLHSSRPGD